MRNDSPPFDIEDQKHRISGKVKKTHQPKEHYQISSSDDRVSEYRIAVVQTSNTLSKSEIGDFLFRILNLIPIGSTNRHYTVFYKDEEIEAGDLIQATVKPTFFAQGVDSGVNPVWCVLDELEEKLQRNVGEKSDK